MLNLHVRPDAYELQLDDDVLARLDGGPATLLAGAGEQLRDLDIEVAIERAEDWLMPSSKVLLGLELRVCGETAQIRKLLGNQASFTATEVESAFARLLDAVAHARASDRDGAAAVVLLRELVHHAKLSRIWVDAGNTL